KATDREAIANGFRLWPPAARNGFANNDDWKRCGCIAVHEGSPAAHWNVHDLEVCRRDRPHLHRADAVFWVAVVLRGHVTLADERQDGCRCRPSDARQLFDALKQGPCEIQAVAVVVRTL